MGLTYLTNAAFAMCEQTYLVCLPGRLTGLLLTIVSGLALFENARHGGIRRCMQCTQSAIHLRYAPNTSALRGAHPSFGPDVM